MKFHFFCAMYKYIMTFNQVYSELLAKLPTSLINEAWIRLTSRKRNPLSEKEASEINPIVESFLKHEAIRYQKRLMRQRRTQVGQSAQHYSKKYHVYLLQIMEAKLTIASVITKKRIIARL